MKYQPPQPHEHQLEFYNSIVDTMAGRPLHERVDGAAFGAGAVRAMAQYNEELAANRPGLDAQIDRDSSRHIVEEEVADLRTALAKLSARRRPRAAELLSLAELPDDLKGALHADHTADGPALMEALAAPDTPDETVTKVAEWHVSRHAKRQEDFRREQVPYLKARYQRMIAQAVYNDDLPPDAMNNVSGRLLFARVVLDDGFNTTLKGTHGYMTMKDDDHQYTVVLSPKTDNATTTHEFTHVIEGQDERAVPFGPDAKQAYRKEARTPVMEHVGLYRIFGLNAGARELGEAVAEHITLGLERGTFDNLDIKTEHHKDRSYLDGGELLQALCTVGRKPINVRLFMWAFGENGSFEENMRNPLSGTYRLMREFEEAFPHINVLEYVASLEDDLPLSEQNRLVEPAMVG